jgi:DNA-binding beta-propeller fold protein YncE
VKTIHLGGEGRWDALTFDPALRRLFISRETHVMVLDVDHEKVIGDIPDTQGVHAIALAPDMNRGFTSNGRAGTVTIFDLTTLTAIDRVTAGQNPDAIVYEPESHNVFAMNGRSNDATVIRARTGAVGATISLGGKPEFAVTDDAGRVYVNLEDKSEVLQIDARTLTVTARWPLAPCEGPSGLAMDTRQRRLFAGCANKILVAVNADTGKVVATLPIGAGVDGTGFDPGAGLAFSSNGEGNLTVVRQDSADTYSVLENVPTQRGARTMTVDPATHQVFLVTADFGPAPHPTEDNPRPRPPLVPDSFVVLVVGR